MRESLRVATGSHAVPTGTGEPDFVPRLERLWERSEVTSPAPRPGHVAAWVRHFASPGRLRWFCVARGDEYVLAVPLLSGGVRYPAPAARLPGNAWGLFGDILIDPGGLTDREWDEFFAMLARWRRWLIRFEPVSIQSPRWVLLAREGCRRGWKVSTRPLFDCPIVEISGDWVAYLTARGKARLRNQKRNLRRLAKAGPWRFQQCHPTDPREAESLLLRCLEVEHGGWKGRRRSSVLSVPSARGFYLEIGRRLAAEGSLELSFLETGTQSIAAAFGWRAKGDHFLIKIGYDEARAELGPGQLLTMQLLQELFATPGARRLDFHGRAEPWSTFWATSLVPLGRLDFVPPGFGPRCLGAAHRAASSFLVRGIRG